MNELNLIINSIISYGVVLIAYAVYIDATAPKRPAQKLSTGIVESEKSRSGKLRRIDAAGKRNAA